VPAQPSFVVDLVETQKILFRQPHILLPVLDKFDFILFCHRSVKNLRKINFVTPRKEFYKKRGVKRSSPEVLLRDRLLGRGIRSISQALSNILLFLNPALPEAE